MGEEEPQANEQDTVLAARRVIERERQARIQRCRAEIEAILSEYGLELAAVPGVTPDGRIAANVVLREKASTP